MKHFGLEFVDKHAKALELFLHDAEMQGYGSGTAPQVFEDGAQTLTYEKGSWLYTDTWYGGEPYSGVTTIAYKGKVCWTMVYWGSVFPGYGKKPIYECLKGALMASNCYDREKFPVRGPENYVARNGYIYHHVCSCRGHVNIKRFYGFETITKPGSGVCYRMDYHGGFVDIR